MSSTDEKTLRRFHADHLVPAAEALRARRRQFFPAGPDDGAETWYVTLPAAEADFVEIDEAALAQTLRARWEAEGLPELAALAEPLLELARSLEVAEEETPDISPFVYVMY